MTRLLVLGAVRFYQPAHGSIVRRELPSWEADQWTHLNPGSVDNAQRTLSQDGPPPEPRPSCPEAPGGAL